MLNRNHALGVCTDMKALPVAATAVLLLSVGWVVAQRERPGQGGPAVGTPAPNFKIKSLDGKSEFELKSNFGKRPTVLIFGSYT